MSNPIKKRYDFVFIFDVTNGNPNGDPDAGNQPRMDPETGHGLVTDVCLKRKVRNFVALAKEESEGYKIYVKEKAVLNRLQKEAREQTAVEAETSKADKTESARKWMCRNYFDVRTFGAVMTTEENCGQVRGPVQIAFSKSVDPISPLEQSITRMAVTNEKDAEKERTMGRKEIVPYGVYRCHGFVSAALAEQTSFSDGDLALFWDALKSMFEHDRSAARGEMASQKLIVFEHESKLGNAPAHKLFERVRITRKDPTVPARKFEDYEVTVDGEGLPAGVRMIEMI